MTRTSELRVDRRTWIFVGVALAVAAALAVFVSPFASSAPDGLERVAQDQGMTKDLPAKPVWDKAPAPDYKTPGIADDRKAMAISGLIGVVIMFGGSYAIARVMLRTKRRDEEALRRSEGS